MIVPQILKSSSTAAALSMLLFDSVQAQNTTQGATGFQPCDALIEAGLSHTVHLPSSDQYPSLVQNGSWPLDTRKRPWCFVQPTNPDEVSRTLVALQAAGGGAGDWHVAVRSGGHASGNANNIAQGVTIDLTQINSTTYDAETNIASIGSGARWGSVYNELDKEGVAVAGGREGVVGVGGLVLAAGISWYTAEAGFACDSVINYEVVLASGEIVNANATANSDLWRALKGGGANFGIVTRFDIEAFPAHNLAIDTRYIDVKHSDEFIDAFAEFTDLDRSYADHSLIMMMTYDPKSEATTMMINEVNVKNKANSSVYDAVNRIPTVRPPTQESVSLAKSASRDSSVAEDLWNAGAGSLTIINDPRVMRYCIEQHNELVKDLQADIGPKSFGTIVDLQPFPSYFADIGAKKGGNMLGLERDQRNKVIFVSGVRLMREDGEDLQPRITLKVAEMNARIQAYSDSIGSSAEFRYLAYASSRQDVIGSYGPENVEHIRCTAEKYDPEGFFQYRVPGGFKVSRVR